MSNLTAGELSEPVRRSLTIFPAGSNGEFNLPADLAIVVARGSGCRLWDSEGREFLDFSMGWGSVLPGHAHPGIAEAVRRQTRRGSNFAYVSTESLALAEEISQASPAAESVRFCASGTEATMYCLRLARAWRGRHRVLKFEGAYHGAHDIGVTSLFPQNPPPFPTPWPSSAGLTGVESSVLIAPFNDADYATGLIETEADTLGAVIVEPLQRCLPPAPGFLEALRDATARFGIPLVFDEVVTGFRLGYGGAQARYGIVPDLVAYGKALGGGYPIGAFGGRKEIMELVREDRLGEPRYVWTASSLGGNPVSCAAARAALAVYRDPATYHQLFKLGQRLRDGMHQVLAARAIPGQVIGDGPLAQVVLSAQPVTDYRSTQAADRSRQRALMLALFRRGIFLNPMGTKLYLSLAHDAAACDALVDRFEDALVEITEPG